jgi:hypothetical protein
VSAESVPGTAQKCGGQATPGFGRTQESNFDMKNRFDLKARFRVACVVAACVLCSNSKATIGIWDDYASVNGVVYEGNFNLSPAYKMAGGVSLGTVSSLVLNGGEAKTFKNGDDDVVGANMWYRVWQTSSGPSGGFSGLSFGWVQDYGGGNQQWNNFSANVDLLNGLVAGNYTLDFYFQSYSQYGPYRPTENNNNGDYLFTFTVVPEPITLALPLFGGLVLTAGMVRHIASRRKMMAV